MLIACWSPKGGSGTTVVACGLAALLARSAGGDGALLADLSGDATAVLGMADPGGPGLAEWLAAGPDVGPSALARLEVEAAPGLRLLAWNPGGSEPVRPGSGRAGALVDALSADPRPVVVDCGPATTGAGLALAAGAEVSLLVLRPCYLALRRALAAPVRPSGVVLVSESGRALGRRDVEDVLGVPVRAEIAIDEAVARAVDAGLLARRIPRSLERALRPLAGPRRAGARDAA